MSRAAVALAGRPPIDPTEPSPRIVPVPAIARPSRQVVTGAVRVRHQRDHQSVRRPEGEVAEPRSWPRPGETTTDGDVEIVARHVDHVDPPVRQPRSGELVVVPAGERQRVPVPQPVDRLGPMRHGLVTATPLTAGDHGGRRAGRPGSGSPTSTATPRLIGQSARRNPTAAAAGSVTAGRSARRPSCMLVGASVTAGEPSAHDLGDDGWTAGREPVPGAGRIDGRRH